jgi:hypothetical protein
MASSTSAGEAPRYSMVIDILSRDVSGKISSFVVKPVTAPASRRNSINKLAATWFSANQAIMLRIDL